MRHTPQLARCPDRDTQCVRERGKRREQFRRELSPSGLWLQARRNQPIAAWRSVQSDRITLER
jgi:hypothetical protein